MQINTALCTLYYSHIAIESTHENIFKEPDRNRRKQEIQIKHIKITGATHKDYACNYTYIIRYTLYIIYSLLHSPLFSYQVSGKQLEQQQILMRVYQQQHQ